MTLTRKDRHYLRWVLAGAPMFSTCSRRQYLAIVIAENGRLAGMGYNGSPPRMGHCVDGACPRGADPARPCKVCGIASSACESIWATSGDCCCRSCDHPNPVPHGSAYTDCIAVHAEANALLWSDRTMRQGGTLYVNGPPCHECGRLIAGSGIARVVHLHDDAYADWPRVRDFLLSAGVAVEGIDRGEIEG